MASRPGHVYFMTDPTPRARLAAGAGAEPHARVDIRSLHLKHLVTDEDRVGAARPLSTHRWVVQQLSGWGELPARPRKMPAGEWMNLHHDIVDRPDWVWHSMTELTVAHRGGVEAALLTFLPLYMGDWEPADPGEVYVEQPPGAPVAHYLGPAEGQPK